MLPRAKSLSSDSNSQCYIENYLEQDSRQKFNFGNFAGWWLGIIDGAVNENGKRLITNNIDHNNNSNNNNNNNNNNIMRQILSETIREVYKNRHISSRLLSHSRLPDTKTIENNGYGLIDISGNRRVEAQESQRLCMFSSLQTPDIVGANCSILAPIQIELALTRPVQWSPFITKIMYFIERFNVDCYREFLKMIVESKNDDSDEYGDGKSQFIQDLPQLLMKGVVPEESAKRITGFLQEAFNVTKHQYVEGSSACSQHPNYKMGEKRLSLFDEVYDILHDIIIANNQNPLTYLKHSRLLLGIYSEIDDFLIDALRVKGYTANTNATDMRYGSKRQKLDREHEDHVEDMDTL